MKVPFLDLKAQYEPIRKEITAEINRVIDNTAFAGGLFVEKFESKLSEFSHTNFAAGVSSGTAALWLSLYGLGIGKGDEVITVSNTFIATVEAITFCGATPVFVDIDEKTYTMNPDLIETAITPKTKAIIPVHLFGQMCDMDPIMEIAQKNNLLVIEDACQAHGVKYKGKPAGSIGDAGCFSFYPGKNLGAFGEAGAVVTNNKELYESIKKIRDHGQSQKYIHSIIGWNDRMDGIQGAILSVNMKYLVKWNDLRNQHAAFYNSLLADIPEVKIPVIADYSNHNFHLYVVRLNNRDEVIEKLKEKEIFCGIHYPIPVHLTEAYSYLGYGQGSLPITEKYANQILSLPMHPSLTEEQINYVCAELKNINVI